MNQHPAKIVPVATAMILIDDLDLEPMKFKLVNVEDGIGWMRDKCESVALEYRRFLKLMVLHPDVTIVPTKDIDAMWHTHILDTSKYMKDCDAIFGTYLHHFPYLGLRGDSDKDVLQNLFESTKGLYLQHFGTDPSSYNQMSATDCSSECGPCGGSCSSCGDIRNGTEFLSRPRLPPLVNGSTNDANLASAMN